MRPWDDQIAVVTGARGSIGSAIVEHLRSLGARVSGSDLPQSGAAAPDTLPAVDVTVPASIEAWLEDVEHAIGNPTVGVICAGITRPGRLVDLSDADWTDVLDVNLTGAFYAARAIIRRMLASNTAGRIVFVGSWAAHAPHPHIGAYSASKAGLRALCQTLALDHAAEGILVNEVAPGIVDAGLSRELFRRDPDLEKRTRAAIPSGRIIHPDDVARDVAFLASAENRHTTGTVLVSDGGLSLASAMNPATATR
ncbi:MAG: SDR family oxidoreductase [Devosia nanyangense]|uniref:SDR family oxidoreductase n=1 Tax=Devosia nanyangense TaxID=1228055 RepID=A0A933L1C6_9HYPH|nr:SDR family oxidoreductase [Devosia nanyangense]